MKHLIALAFVLALAAPASAQERATVADLAWLAGSWIEQDGGKTTREVWHAPLDGAMSGVGQTTRPGKPPFFEFMTITSETAGPTFRAYIKGQDPTDFLLKPGPAGEAVFENLAHDFPQRVIYRRCGEDLCGRIEGVEKGRAKAVDWRYRRAN